MDPLAALRDENETLREEICQLRALRLPPETRYLGFGFTRTQRTVVAALMNADTLCARDYLLDCITLSRASTSSTEPKTIDVMICRVRKKLTNFGFPGAIETERGEGWRVTAAQRERLRAFFDARSGEKR